MRKKNSSSRETGFDRGRRAVLALGMGLSLLLSLPRAAAAHGDDPDGRVAASGIAGKSEGASGEVDPFLAGALGVLPFMSGFYIGPSPEKGLIFSLVDVLLVLGIRNARQGRQQEEGNANLYYGLICLNNVLDAGLSMRHSLRRRGPAARLEWTQEGGLALNAVWKF